MSRFVVLGAGGIGAGTARELAGRGHEVVLGSRSGGRHPAGMPGLREVAVDATDAAAVSSLATGAHAIVNALNPSRYTAWDRDWPPMAAALLRAAEHTGAGLVTVSNLYGYGPVDGPITEATPLRPAGIKGQVRAQMWTDALAAHEAGRVRASELRASDYFGPQARPDASYLNRFVVDPARRGKPVRLVMGDADAAHSWTYLPDIVTLAATLATDDRSWGRAWLVPTAAPRSVRQVVADVASVTGEPPPRVSLLPGPVRAGLRVVPTIRALDETRHQFDGPFVLDASATERAFDVHPTGWADALRRTVDDLGSAAAA